MFRLYSFKTAKRAIKGESAFIRQVSEKYDIPASWIQAVLLKEMTELNLLDLLADLAVRAHYLYYRISGHEPRSGPLLLRKKDSSTGWAQIFGFVGIDVLNHAADRGRVSYGDLGIVTDHRLRKENPEDLWMIWKRLNRDRQFNIELCALNLLACAEEMNGRSDVRSFSEEETKRTFTRYNADVRHITRYGETTYGFHQEFSRETL